jgi:serine protease inhibitor ecotin
MTVPELIEKLQSLPGDSSLKTIRLEVGVHRQYAKPATVDCSAVELTSEGTSVTLRGWGWEEYRD